MSGYSEFYHAIASRMAFYRSTNERLVALAELRPGMAVLDLASGSGLTALAALAKVPQGLRLFLLDQSPAMIETARKYVGDRAEAYYVADALEVASRLPVKVDRVLCNMSLTSLRQPEEVLKQLRTVLKPAGRLCFSLSGTYFNTNRDVVSPQYAFLDLLARHGRITRGVPAVDRLPNQRSIEGTLSVAGFKPFFFEVQDLPVESPETEPGGELYNLLRLYPLAELGEPQASLDQLTALAKEMAGYNPRWCAVHFMAQPAISPDEALMLRMQIQSAGKGPGAGVS